jgi:predicted RNase H-like HicB family nuclease
MIDMKNRYTAVIKQRGRWWIGWIEEVPGVNCQEATREELLESLRITLQEALEFNRREALEAAGDSFEEEPITIGTQAQ